MSECKCGDLDDEVCDGCWKVNSEMQITALRAEVERLREAARQVHALAVTEERDYRCVRVVEQLNEIHKITKGLVE